MAVASIYFFSFALAPLIEDDPSWRGWPFPESPGSGTWAMLPGRPEVRKSIHDCRELATGGPTAVATSIAAFSAALFGREETADSLVRFSEDGAKNAKKYFPEIL